jgi:hypothetical protein
MGMIEQPVTWHVFDGMDGQFYIRHRDGEFEDGPFASRAEAQGKINEMGRDSALVPLLFVTDGDRVLCQDCYREEFHEQDPVTHLYATVGHGICDACGLVVQKRGK